MKSKLLLLIVVLLVIAGIFYLVSKDTTERHVIELPIGYTLDSYQIAETTEVSCKQDSDCETPSNYLIRSNCPYTSICLQNKCTVVCPNHE